MTAIAPGDKIFVSGANGYIGAWMCQHLLEKGYAVRGAVRSLEKRKHLTELFKPFGEKFETVVVEDIMKDGAFDEAVEGVQAIIHTASPITLLIVDPEEFIQPAVQGTLNVLRSALKNESIKRVIIISTANAMMRADPNALVFDENDWNELSIKEVERLGKDASTLQKYEASKTLAEKVAWNFYNTNKNNINWDLTVLNPCMVFGPPIHDLPKPEDLNFSLSLWHNVVMVEGSMPEGFLRGEGNFIDVRDVGEASVRALEVKEAGGERIILSTGSYVWQDWMDIANSLSPSPIPSHPTLPRGSPGAGRGVINHILLNNSKEARILGIRHRNSEEITRDTLADFERRGW